MADVRLEQTAEGWDAVANGYAEHLDPDLAAYTEGALEIVPVGEGDRVLDVACGSGSLAIRAAKRGAQVLAVDFSKEQIRILGDRIEGEDLDGIRAQLMDGQALDLDDATYDTAFSMFGLMLFPDRASGFSEMHRVLRSGGRAAVSAWADPSEIEWFALFKDAVDAGLPDLPPPPNPPFIELADPDRLAREMTTAGFENVTVHTLEADSEMPGIEGGWRKLAETSPVLPGLIDRVGAEAVERIRQAFAELYEERYGTGPVVLGGKAYLAVGTRPRR